MNDQTTVSRRGFLAATGASAAAASLLAACGSESSASGETKQFGDGDAGILNFLLTVEYVQAAFYKKLLASNLYSEAERNALGKFGEEEEEHIGALTRQIEKAGGTPADEVKTKFSLQTGPATLELASTLENTGAAAYLGQLPNIEDNGVRTKVVEIHSVEGRHAAAINFLLKQPVTPDGAFAKPAKAKAVLATFKPFIVE